MRPFFSIIIPALNEEKYIGGILRDLSRQKKQNFEIIVVDGNSLDGTRTIAALYAEKLPLICEVVDKANLSGQKNWGAQKAKGVYLLFLDADMSVSPNFTSAAEQLIRKKKGLVFMPYVTPREKKEFPEIQMIFPLINRLVEVSQFLKKPFSNGPCMIWERNTFLFVGGFDMLFNEDHLIIRKAAAWGIRVQLLHGLRAKFSLRRMKRDGRLSITMNFLMSHLYLLFNDRINSKSNLIYEMGGHVTGKKPRFNGAKMDPKQIVRTIKKFLLE